jgi:hypothetical protein
MMAKPTQNIDTALLERLQPFYTATVCFKAPKADAHAYDCAVCGTDIGPKSIDAAPNHQAISYHERRYGTWAHLTCLEAHGIAAQTDKKLKDAARVAAHQRAEQDKTAQKVTAPSTAPTTPPATTSSLMIDTAKIEREIRASVEADYQATMTQATALIERLMHENATMKAALAALDDLADARQIAACEAA